MLTEIEMRKITFKECCEMYGPELVKANIDNCCSSWGIKDNGMFEYALGLDTEEMGIETEPLVLIGEEIPFPYHAWVTIDPKIGEVTRNYEISTLPK